MNIPFFDMSARIKPLKNKLVEDFQTILDSGIFCLGPFVECFEADFARYVGAKHCVAMSSGTAALHIAMRCLDIGVGDEVITSPLTFASTCWAISYVGATPIFADVDLHSYTLSAEKMIEAITPKTKAVIPVHLFGYPVDIEKIIEVCKPLNIAVVEDAAQAHGAKINGVTIGGLNSALTCFSFYPGKSLGGIGEGGAITTNDSLLAARAKHLRVHAERERYHYDEIGFNYRMDAIQGSALCRMLPQLDKWNDERRHIAHRYNALLKGTPLVLPEESSQIQHSWYIYSVLSDERDDLLHYLSSAGIECRTHYPMPMHLQPCYRHLNSYEKTYKNAEYISCRCLSLPMFPEMTIEQQDYIINAIFNYYKGRLPYC